MEGGDSKNNRDVIRALALKHLTGAVESKREEGEGDVMITERKEVRREDPMEYFHRSLSLMKHFLFMRA